MAGMGFPPKPNARRRNAYDSTTFSAGPCTLPPPVWPLSQASSREMHLWGELWKSPQAAAWHEMGWSAELGLYVRNFTQAEAGSTGASQEARLLSDRWGINPAAMLRLRWSIAEPVTPSPVASLSSARRRLAAIEPDAESAS